MKTAWLAFPERHAMPHCRNRSCLFTRHAVTSEFQATLWTNTLSHDMRLLCRFAGAVTAFAPGSNASMPPTGVSLPGVFMAEDWLAQGPATHGAKGLSQEKTYVTGLQAGNQVAVAHFIKQALRCNCPA